MDQKKMGDWQVVALDSGVGDLTPTGGEWCYEWFRFGHTWDRGACVKTRWRWPEVHWLCGFSRVPDQKTDQKEMASSVGGQEVKDILG